MIFSPVFVVSFLVVLKLYSKNGEKSVVILLKKRRADWIF